MKRLMLLSTALIFAASMSMAAITADDLVAAYQAQGYTKIEVKTGLTQIKVEAVMGLTKVEVIYDATTLVRRSCNRKPAAPTAMIAGPVSKYPARIMISLTTAPAMTITAAAA